MDFRKYSVPFNFTCTKVEFRTTCKPYKTTFKITELIKYRLGWTEYKCRFWCGVAVETDLDEVQVPVVEARAAHGVVLRRLVEAQVHQQLAALQRRAHQRLLRLPVPGDHSHNLTGESFIC